MPSYPDVSDAIETIQDGVVTGIATTNGNQSYTVTSSDNTHVNTWTSTTGDDTIIGGAGNDWLDGGIDDDYIEGGAGNDYLDGGYGYYSGQNFGRWGGNDTLKGGLGNDVVDGGLGADFVAGNLGDDIVLGGYGPDLVFGGHGDDYLSGGDEYDQDGSVSTFGDHLDGGPGDDTIDGGGSNDVFVFNTTHHGNGNDVVVDYHVGDMVDFNFEQYADYDGFSVQPDTDANGNQVFDFTVHYDDGGSVTFDDLDVMEFLHLHVEVLEQSTWASAGIGPDYTDFMTDLVQNYDEYHV